MSDRVFNAIMWAITGPLLAMVPMLILPVLGVVEWGQYGKALAVLLIIWVTVAMGAGLARSKTG